MYVFVDPEGAALVIAPHIPIRPCLICGCAMAKANPSKGFPFSAKKSMSKVVHKKPANMQCPKAKPKTQGLAQSPPKSQSSSSALVRTKEQEEQDLRFWARLHHSQAQEEYEQGGQGSMYQVQSTPKKASPMYKAQPKGKLKVQPKRKPKVPPTSHFGPQPKPPGAGIYVAQALAKTQGAGVNPNKRWRAGALCPIVSPPALSPPPPKSQTSAVLAQGMRITENAPRKLCSMVVPQHMSYFAGELSDLDREEVERLQALPPGSPPPEVYAAAAAAEREFARRLGFVFGAPVESDLDEDTAEDTAEVSAATEIEPESESEGAHGETSISSPLW